MVMTQEQSSHPSGRVILVPFKRVEADEVRLQEHVFCFLEQWVSSSQGVFSSVAACEFIVLHKSTKGFYGSCWEKMPDKWHTQDWFLHHDNTSCHMDSQLVPVPNQKKMVVVSGLSTSPSLSSWRILVLKDRKLLKGWRFKDIMKTKLSRRQHWSTSENRSFRGVSSCGRDTG